MPKKIIDDIKITPVEYADQVIKIALTKELKPTEWVEVDLAKKDDKSQMVMIAPRAEPDPEWFPYPDSDAFNA